MRFQDKLLALHPSSLRDAIPRYRVLLRGSLMLLSLLILFGIVVFSRNLAATQSGEATPPAAAPAQPTEAKEQTADQKQLVEDSAHLLKMANELKAEVDRTNQEVLSLSVIHKAEEIERGARAMRQHSGGGRAK